MLQKSVFGLDQHRAKYILHNTVRYVHVYIHPLLSVHVRDAAEGQEAHFSVLSTLRSVPGVYETIQLSVD